jgi:hypothetical protein
LINAGLIRRKNGKYYVTSLGKVVYKAQELMEIGVQCSSKLKALDSIESSEFPAAELSKIIDTLISRSEIKEILVSRQRNNNIPVQQGDPRSSNKTLKYTILKQEPLVVFFSTSSFGYSLYIRRWAIYPLIYTR